MTTVRDICEDALIEIGALSVGEAMPAADGAFALRTLNRMVEKWNTEQLMPYTVNRTSFNLVAGTQSYTLGTGGTFNMTRPERIDRASVIINSTYPIEIPIQILTDEEWQAVAVKTSPSTFPTKMWANGDYPLNVLYFWPLPQDSTVDVILYTWGMVSFATLNTAISLPNGWEEALVTNLALHLSGSYGIQPSPALAMRGSGAKAAIESLNVGPMYASFDAPFSGRATAINTNGLLVDR